MKCDWIVVAACQRNLRPLHVSPVHFLAMNPFQYLLEAAYAAENFRSETDLPPEQFDEAARTQSDAFRCYGNAVGHAKKRERPARPELLFRRRAPAGRHQ